MDSIVGLPEPSSRPGDRLQFELGPSGGCAAARLWRRIAAAVLGFCRARIKQFELPALDLLLEHAEARLLTDVEHLVDAVVGPPQLGGDARLELLQRRQPLLQHASSRWRRRPRVGEPLELVDQPRPLLLVAPPRVLQHAEPRAGTARYCCSLSASACCACITSIASNNCWSCAGVISGERRRQRAAVRPGRRRRPEQRCDRRRCEQRERATDTQAHARHRHAYPPGRPSSCLSSRDSSGLLGGDELSGRALGVCRATTTIRPPAPSSTVERSDELGDASAHTASTAARVVGLFRLDGSTSAMTSGRRARRRRATPRRRAPRRAAPVRASGTSTGQRNHGWPRRGVGALGGDGHPHAIAEMLPEERRRLRDLDRPRARAAVADESATSSRAGRAVVNVSALRVRASVPSTASTSSSGVRWRHGSRSRIFFKFASAWKKFALTAPTELPRMSAIC